MPLPTGAAEQILITAIAQLDACRPDQLSTTWLLPTARVLARMDDELSEHDRSVLKHFNTLLLNCKRALAVLTSRPGYADAIPATGTHARHPVSMTLVAAARIPNWAPPVKVLLGALCELALRRADGRQIGELAERIRGGLAGYDVKLAPALGTAGSLADLVRVLQGYMDQLTLTRVDPAAAFVGTWRRWLSRYGHGWLVEDPAWRAAAYRSSVLRPDADAASIDMEGDHANPDDALAVDHLQFDPGVANEAPRSARTDVARARASYLLRGTDGELLLPPAFVLPSPRAAEVIALAIDQAKQASADTSAEAEPFLAFCFLAATGVRELDLGRVRWGAAVDKGHPWVVDPEQPCLWRSVVRPPSAFSPPKEMQQVLEPSADALPWPIPPTLHALLVRHAPPGRHVTPFPRAASRIEGYRLADTLRHLTLGTTLGAQPFRKALAAYLAQSLGTDVAQLALGDAFSVSIAPTYYTAATAAQVWRAMAPMLAQWFREPISTQPPPGATTFGSRLALTAEAAAAWPASLRAQRRSAARRKDRTAVDEWIAHRNALAAALCAVTGHRPTQALGQLDLHQVIPEYNLVLLQDKQVDPLRKLRIAGTGGHWIADLRVFLDRLHQQSDRGDAAGTLAQAILGGRAPLFTVPGTKGPQAMTPAELRETMPTPLGSAPNHYRHRLSQQLLAMGVDPELRFAQLGWVVSPAFASADLSPRAPAELGRELAPMLDAYLEAEHWYSNRHRIATWHWQGLPEAAWLDWESVIQAEVSAHEQTLARVRAELRERGRTVLESVWPRLQLAAAELFPEFELVLSPPRLKRRTEPHAATEPATITEDLCGLLLDRVRHDEPRAEDALEGVMARAALAKLLRRSHREGLTQGYLPRTPILSVTAQPSPFLPGSGRAVRQIALLRRLLTDRTHKGYSDDVGYLAYFGVLLSSPYRTTSWARAAVEAAGRATRSPSPGDILRIPAHVDRRPVQMVFGGPVALMLARRGVTQPLAHAPTMEQAEAWLQRILTQAGQPPVGLAAVVSAAQASARVELSGPERLQLLNEVSVTSAPVERCLARDGDWPARTATPAIEPKPLADSAYAADDAADHPGTAGGCVEAVVPALRKLLNPERFAAGRTGSSDSHRGWRAALQRELGALTDQLALTPDSNAWVLVRYARHRAEYGGERKRNLAHQTLYNDVLRIAERLQSIAGARLLLDQGEPGLQAIYLGVLEATRPSMRPEIAEALHRFHAYLEQFHRAPTISWSAMAAVAGKRVESPDPGLLTRAELMLVWDQLHRDLEYEQRRADASPDLVRLAELRVLLFALLASSGIRPRSSHGLLLSDLLLFEPGHDWVHVHRTGGYGVAKTAASIGFVPLLGPLWERARVWIVGWHGRECAQLPADKIAKTPLFANQSGATRRFHRVLLERRIADLIRWACADSRARLYWLRKTWVTEQHRDVALGATRLARGQFKVLCESGHTSIQTPLTHYVADPAVVVAHSVVAGRTAARSLLLVASGLPPGSIDLAWNASHAAETGRRIAVALDHMGHPPAATPDAAVGEAPALLSQGRLLPIDIDRYARARHRADPEEALILAGLTRTQGLLLEQAAGELLLLRGIVPWPVEGLAHPRAVLRMPRVFESAAPILRTLSREPDTEALWLADRWARSGHAKRLGATTNEVITTPHEDTQRVCKALTTIGVEPTAIQARQLKLGTAIRIARELSNDSSLTLTDSASMHWMLAQIWLWSRALAPLTAGRAETASS